MASMIEMREIELAEDSACRQSGACAQPCPRVASGGLRSAPDNRCGGGQSEALMIPAETLVTRLPDQLDATEIER